MNDEQCLQLSRRALLMSGGATVAGAALSSTQAQPAPVASSPSVPTTTIDLVVDGKPRRLDIDLRTTLLDALRENLQITGPKKGCDQGQCGACTVLVDGRRINACLSLAVMNAGKEVTTIEGLGSPDAMHPMQKAFVKHDGFQCGYCTPGQICSAIAVIEEIRAGVPSHAAIDPAAQPLFSAAELRERMSGNLCRCGAYSNIIDAIGEVAAGRS